MNQFLRKLWKNEEGAELVEWVIVAAILVAIAATVYGTLETKIDAAVTDIGNKLTEEAPKAD